VDTTKYGYHNVLIVSISEQEDSSCLQLIHWRQTSSKTACCFWIE